MLTKDCPCIAAIKAAEAVEKTKCHKRPKTHKERPAAQEQARLCLLLVVFYSAKIYKLWHPDDLRAADPLLSCAGPEHGRSLYWLITMSIFFTMIPMIMFVLAVQSMHEGHSNRTLMDAIDSAMGTWFVAMMWYGWSKKYGAVWIAAAVFAAGAAKGVFLDDIGSYDGEALDTNVKPANAVE